MSTTLSNGLPNKARLQHHSPDPWTINSWRSRSAQQQPQYPDQAIAASIMKTISSLPPLVHQTEIEQLKLQLEEVARGERFLLQAGDCAERFVDCNENTIENRLKTLVQMSKVLATAGLPVVVVGRVAGQYAKPRSTPFDVHNGRTMNVFRGENINGLEWNHREHDPARLLSGYFHSAATLNCIRALLENGFAEGVVDMCSRYEEIAAQQVSAAENRRPPPFEHFISHEGLVLDYEQALTRSALPSKGSLESEQSELNAEFYYNFGAHFLWIGKRTRDINDSHVEYFRGISNPIGIKIDSELSAENLVNLLETLDPNKVPGRVTLISRFGCDKIATDLPERIEAVKGAGRGEIVIWSCDPMHGNTYTTSEGISTRNFDHVLNELTDTLKVLQQHGCRLGSIHLEMTGEDVTECIGGPQKIDETQLKLRYSSLMDPRLNYTQSMEITFLLANQMKK